MASQEPLTCQQHEEEEDEACHGRREGNIKCFEESVDAETSGQGYHDAQGNVEPVPEKLALGPPSDLYEALDRRFLGFVLLEGNTCCVTDQFYGGWDVLEATHIRLHIGTHI